MGSIQPNYVVSCSCTYWYACSAIFLSILYAAPKPTLQNGEQLLSGDFLKSNNGEYTLRLETDGTLVIYKGTEPNWSSGKRNTGTGPYKLRMQNDNNLVIYDSTNSHVWHIATSGQGTAGEGRLYLRDNGKLVVYGTDEWSPVLWTSPGELFKKFQNKFLRLGFGGAPNFIIFILKLFISNCALWCKISGDPDRRLLPWNCRLAKVNTYLTWQTTPQWQLETIVNGQLQSKIVKLQQGNLVCQIPQLRLPQAPLSLTAITNLANLTGKSFFLIQTPPQLDLVPVKETASATWVRPPLLYMPNIIA